MKEKLLKRAYTLLIFSVNSIIILILTTIKYKSKFDEMKSYSEIFINPNYKGWANVIYICLILISVTFAIGVSTYKKYKKYEND
ncbi:hypothetical protein KQI88_05585 [Alkaliphilus sp. MSJ-5]|uniref:Uncharacterized protein n=1 Tax=Alkaliphilus flagellatus TaxID=2841507 RepID=A0ABS6G163_9FIRM|nr:hypothetical protein [Alkaliphilus flagellatus]MBU5675881.1 hypothetical protein [Alkaliphilus flagellatus]